MEHKICESSSGQSASAVARVNLCRLLTSNLEKSLSRTSWRYQLCRPRWPMGRGTILRAKV